MSTGANGREKLLESLRDREYRHHFASAVVRRGIAEQLREMRLSRGWTQNDLARASGKVQETISQLEDPNYGSYTYKTLQRLAEALDVALVVKFATFSELADWMANLSPEDLAVPDFEHDPGLARGGDYIETKLTAHALPPMRRDLVGPGLRLLPSSPPPQPYHWATVTGNETNGTFELSLAGD